MFVYFVFVFFILHYCNTVGLTWWDWRLILRTLSFFSALTLLVGSHDRQKPVPDMTYSVFAGTLNLIEFKLKFVTAIFIEFGKKVVQQYKGCCNDNLCIIVCFLNHSLVRLKMRHSRVLRICLFAQLKNNTVTLQLCFSAHSECTVKSVILSPLSPKWSVCLIVSR